MILPLLWLAATAAGFFYSQQRQIPHAVYWAVLPAFLLEVTFYYALGDERWRARLERWPSAALASLLVLSDVAPYAAATLLLHSFQWNAVAAIGALALVGCFWYVVLPHRGIIDMFFLLFMAVVMLARVLHHFYPVPNPRIPLEILGQLMWIRTGAFALLSIRKVKGVGFGFIPRSIDWKIGSLAYLIFVPVAAGLAWAIGFSRPHAPEGDWLRMSLYAIATFLGTLWVTALGEEFFFRGLLQQWLVQWARNEWVGIAIASLVFGAVHLWFRTFPNWRFAVLAAVAGVCYGVAFRQAKSIRASMVAHALVATTWRLFF